DVRRLLLSGPDYWWHSPLNPHKPDGPDVPYLEFGRAVHKLVLEGRQAFVSRYMRRPPGIARLTEKKKTEIAPNGESVLDADDYDRIAISGELIAENPELAAAFEGGVPEVSVFWWTVVGDLRVRCKARFDYLKVRGVGDLKSIRNIFGQAFHEACTRAIVHHRYDIQAAHYLEGRAEMARLHADGLVYGDHDRGWLKRCVGARTFAFQWVFFQAEGAPITWSRSLSPGNPILDIAERDRHKALETFRDFKETFGPGDRWTLKEPVSELEINQMPGWYR
ncbi:MAG TPA: PD-(D/E)XK nuclease-like domain-containing protein, partial [Candidatus Cybelea sp.]|nr:PD-(D/E)XK nuclease-like domain-containing protein [Candidatus Cybelea sp.]